MSKKIQQIAADLIEADEDNVKMMRAMDDMWQMRWNLPSQIAGLPWVRKKVSSDPHDAVRAATRVLATVMPKLKLTPLAANIETRDRTDELERALMWHLALAFNRKAKPLSTIVWQALMYDRVCAQVVHLPNQQKAMGTFQEDKHRLKYAKRFGDFAIIMRDPKCVHAEWSDWMLERVVYGNEVTLGSLKQFWGKKADALRKAARKKKLRNKDMVTVYDYQDLESRYVWCYPTGESGLVNANDDNAIVILEEDNDLDFLPWAIKQGGEDLISLLYSIWRANQWADQNVMGSINISEVIAYFAAPRFKETGPGETVIDYGEPARTAKVPPGSDIEQIPPIPMDPNLLAMVDRLQAEIAKGTIPNVITMGEIPAGAAYATVNLATQSGVKAVNTYKELAEDALADIVRIMLYWIDYTGEEIVAYPTVLGGETNERIGVSKGDFDPEQLYLEIELTADVPTDRLQRMNAAVMGRDKLNVSMRSSHEQIGIPDSGAEQKQWYEEQQRLGEFRREEAQKDMVMQRTEQLKTQELAALQQMNLQMQAQAMQQQMAQQQQPQQQAVQPAGQPREAPRGSPGFENIRGQGFNPAQGGQPPITAAPGETRELQASQRARAVEE
jgi:hypothetical protein